MLSGPFPSRALWPQAHRSSHPLADLLALEARPKRIAVWAPNGALFTSLYHYFPRAELFAIDSAAEAVGARMPLCWLQPWPCPSQSLQCSSWR